MSDLLLTLRSLLRTPAFTAVVVLVLALGIGANTAIFSVVDAAMLKPMPIPDADRVVRISLAPIRNRSSGSTRADSRCGRRSRTRDRSMRSARTPTGELTLSGLQPRAIARGRRDARNLRRVQGCSPIGQGVHERRCDERIVSSGGHQSRALADAFQRRNRRARPPDCPQPADVRRAWCHAARVRDAASSASLGPVILGRARRRCPSDVSRLLSDAWRLASTSRAGQSTKSEDGRRPSGKSTLKPALKPAVTPLRDTLVGDVRPIILLLAAGALIVLLVASTNIASLLLTRVSARAARVCRSPRTRRIGSRYRAVRSSPKASLLSAMAFAATMPIAMWTLDASAHGCPSACMALAISPSMRVPSARRQCSRW